jgi:putative two-component system response regulator
MLRPEAIAKANILIVEDDPLSSKLLTQILCNDGFKNVRSLDNADNLCQVYKEYAPDLLILDLGLPGIDGFEAMKRLQPLEKDDYLPILVITAEEDEKIHLRALAAGAKDFLTKPYDRAKVILRSRNLIQVRLLHREIQTKNRDLEKIVGERTRELKDSRIDVIRRLGFASEYRDNETGMHIMRMSRYAAELARALGMSAEDCELVLTTSPLHDVGKIAIPDRILLKPGPLTPDEWEIMKTHAEIGGRLLSGGSSAFLSMAEMIALTHHERWDGSGYPRGLKGEDIPLVGRICSVCDVFDALTSERPYKKAWSFEDAIKEIARLSGASFDPKVVEVFLSLIPQMRQIYQDVDQLSIDATRRLLLNR